jgi:Ca2+-dependent lipid-binding protein
MLSRGLGKKKDEELPDPSPVLYLNIQSAWGVADKDVGGLSDPYAVVKLENMHSHEEFYEFKTKSINDTLDPVWDHSERVDGMTLTY